MKPLIVLIVVFVITLLISRFTSERWNFVLAGSLAMFLMLCVTALGHFKFTQGMSMMIPGPVPFKKEIVYLTGFIEILLGLLLLFPQWRMLAGLLLIGMFVFMLPANIHAALHHIDFEKANTEGQGPRYLWFRIPLQLFFIAWTWFFTVRIPLKQLI